MRSVAIECGLCRSGRARRPAWTEVWHRPAGNESKMTGTGRGGKTLPLGHQEPISCDTERGVVVEPAPVPAFKVPQSQLLFQLLIIPFDDPAVFGHLDQSFELGSGRQRRYPIFGGFFFLSRPLDQQPFLLVWFSLLAVPVSRAYSNGGKARLQFPLPGFTPSDFPECGGGQPHR